MRYAALRLRRLRTTPHAAAFGCSAGILVAFTPFLGLHVLAAAGLAWVFRASILASLLGTFIGNPLTYPFIWVGSYQLGCRILGRDPVIQSIDLSAGIFQTSMDTIWPVIKPMTVGGLPMGLFAACVSYYLVKRAVEAYQTKRGRDGTMPTGPRTARA